MSDIENIYDGELPAVLEPSRSVVFSEDCIRNCPRLHKISSAALIRAALEGGDQLEVLNQEVQSAKDSGELPTSCEVGPTTLSERDTRVGGARVSLNNLSGASLWGVDGWGKIIANVCQIDREKALKGLREEDIKTGLFDGEIKTDFPKETEY